LRFLEGIYKDGQAGGQLELMLNGKTGEILVVIVAKVATWDQTMVNNILGSIQYTV
jgi:hypothetical protein